jgi:hypothetical protein
MTAISKNWVTLTDAATDADSPVDQALTQGYRDDLVHLREWLGASYTAGAVQDHNHDGVNSALVEIGPNAIRNGSFEDGTNGWTLTAYTGGTVATNTANDMDGATALAVTSTSTANGGGDALSDEYVSCTGGLYYDFSVGVKASVANVSSKAEVVWYSDAKAQISAGTIYSTTNTRTGATKIGAHVLSPSTARFYRVKLTGGIPGSGSATGTVYFDGIVASGLAAGERLLEAGSLSTVASLDIRAAIYDGFANLRLDFDGFVPANNGVSLCMRTSTDNGSSFSAGASDYNYSVVGTYAGGSLADQNSTATSVIYLTGVGFVGNGSAASLSGSVNIRMKNSSARYTTVDGQTVSVDNSGASGAVVFNGARLAAEVNNGFQLLFSSGNIASGSYRLYGWN